ncbi:MAG: cyanophycinase [Blastocatellia bacterium]|nr:cyanophycinase [Blastocatellia bacterium]
MKNILVVLARALATVAVAPSVGPKKGALVIVGGGRIPPAIAEKFIALAGGPNANVVHIPTAAEDQALSRRDDADSPKLFGLKNVTVLHTRNRSEADTERFAAPIRKATGVWFGGGRQWRLVDSYLDTRVHRELRALLDRGGVIGGTSAGATIQGSYLVRGAREGNSIMMAPGYEIGLGFLRNVAIDQHIDARKRETHLKEVIAAHPELLGIGLYESTAIVVKGDQFEIIGDGKAAITDGKEHGGQSYYLLSPGERFDLKGRRKASETNKDK